ncbi:MAG: hypothetical protein AB7Q30_10225 [Vicinamibacteria bacterium]
MVKVAAFLVGMAGQVLLWGRVAAGDPVANRLFPGFGAAVVLIWWSRRDWNTLATNERTRGFVSSRMLLAIGSLGLVVVLGMCAAFGYFAASRRLAREKAMAAYTAYTQFVQEAARVGAVKSQIASERKKPRETVLQVSEMYRSIRPAVQELRALVEKLEPRLKVLRVELERTGLPIELVRIADLTLRSFQIDREQLLLLERELALSQEMDSVPPERQALFFDERIARLWGQHEPLDTRRLAVQEEILAIGAAIRQKAAAGK